MYCKGRSDVSDRPLLLAQVLASQINKLEDGPQSELAETSLVMVAVVGCIAEAALLAADNDWTATEVGRVRGESVVVHIGVVENVVAFGPELQLHALRNSEGLAEGEVEIPGARPIELIPLGHIPRERTEVGYSE